MRIFLVIFGQRLTCFTESDVMRSVKNSFEFRPTLNEISSHYYNSLYDCIANSVDREPLRIGRHDGRGVMVGGHCGFPLKVYLHLDVPCRVPYNKCTLRR